MNTAMRLHPEGIYIPRRAEDEEKALLAMNEADLLRVGAEDFDTIRDMRLYIELPNGTSVELHEATTEPGQWRATVTIGGEAYDTRVHCLHGRLRETWQARNRARNRETTRLRGEARRANQPAA